MSLKARLILLVAGALAISFIVGGALIVLLEARWLQADIESEADVARRLVESRAAEISEESESTERVYDLLRSLEARHHLYASFAPARAGTEPAPQIAAAGGFWSGVLGIHATTREIPIGEDGSRGRVVITTDPAGAMTKLWDATRLGLAAAAAFALSTLALVAAGLTRSLDPLGRLAQALAQVGSGDYSARIGDGGPPEIARIGARFDAMAVQLQEMQSRTQALTQQLIAVRERERREIARDLHDELGPCLLAANLDVSSLARLSKSRRWEQVDECAAALGSVLDRMQTLVRSMIERMHLEPSEFESLDEAIEDLIAFWRERRPDIAWRRAPDDSWRLIPQAMTLPIFKVVQEAVSNAVRHSGAGAIAIDCIAAGREIAVRVTDDGAGIPEDATPGFGLAGMRARIEAVGGAFAVISARGRGATIEARITIGERPAISAGLAPAGPAPALLGLAT